jgi:hypothetical protein
MNVKKSCQTSWLIPLMISQATTFETLIFMDRRVLQIQSSVVVSCPWLVDTKSTGLHRPTDRIACRFFFACNIKTVCLQLPGRCHSLCKN